MLRFVIIFIICQTASKNIHYLSFCIYLAPSGLPSGSLRFTATNLNVKYLFLLLPTGPVAYRASFALVQQVFDVLEQIKSHCS